MLSVKIKDATSLQHQELEKIIVHKIRSIRCAADYIDLLKIFYGYFGGLETIAVPLIAPFLPDVADRRKVNSLKNDLNSLKASIPVMATGNELPEINGHLQAFGAMYVMEGSTLGGQFIIKMIRQLFPVDNTAMTFFNGYGEMTLAMWTRFQSVLSNHAATSAGEDEIIASANATFKKFKDWIRKHQVS